MPKPKDKNEDQNGINVDNKDQSSIAEFINRPVPTNEEVDELDGYLNNKYRDDQIEESLSEIYQNDSGDVVDVSKLRIKKRRGFFYWIFFIIFMFGIFGGGGFFGYKYWYSGGVNNSASLEFTISGEEEVVSGEEFFYVVNYRNLSNVALKFVSIKLKYPDNFAVLDASPSGAGVYSGSWQFENVAANYNGVIKIRGKIIGIKGSTGVVIGDLSYEPENISSEFKKESSFVTHIKDVGLDVDFDFISPILVNEDNEIMVIYNAGINNYINNFRLTVEPAENMEFVKSVESSDVYTVIRSGVYQIDEVTDEVNTISIKYKFSEKTIEPEQIVFNFEQSDDVGKYHAFLTKVIDIEVMRSDLNLALIINGSRNDQGIDFGETLNYTVAYTNKGETEMKDVVIMAVLDGDFLDWESFSSDIGGKLKNGSISWNRTDIEGLASLQSDDEGIIDFSIKVKTPDSIAPNKDYTIKSYAQYSVGESSNDGKDNRSNEITNTINSDLELSEEVRYFSKEDIPVGTGPLPPKSGETTTLKVYWVLSNSLHELNGTQVSVALPDYVSWSGKDNATAGTITYQEEVRKVIWDVGRLPVSWQSVEAEFSISVTPTNEDIDRIMILLPGSSVTATDKETRENISRKTIAKTTKLEDDPIAKNSGVVEEGIPGEDEEPDIADLIQF